MTVQRTDSRPTGARRNPIIRLFSSIWFAITMITLIVIYASIVSAIPPVRGAIEVTEMQAFQHWLFVGMVALLTLSVVAVTWVRIRWNLINAGVVTVHLGLILLVLSCAWYFGTKIEGDVVLHSPMVVLQTNSGGPIPGGKLLAEAGQHWHNFMPAFGGKVSVEVVSTKPGKETAVQDAEVRVQLGDAPARTVHLVAGGPTATQTIGGRLRVQLVTPEPKRVFYTDEVPVIYYGPSDQRVKNYAPVDGLPMFRERYLDDGVPLRDSDGHIVPSKRTWPHVSVFGIDIPTGWFEPWRFPIDLKLDKAPFDVTIDGFVPYIAGMSTTVVEGGDQVHPALDLSLSAGDQSIQRWLVADDPSRSMLATAVPFEFHWVASADEAERILAPVQGPHELTIEVRDPPVRETIAIHQGQVIEVEGTPYKLTIKQLSASWPMMTPGYEGAVSPMASVDVDNGQKRYNRTVIQRFPQLSQDIDEKGKRHREGPYDANLVLTYRTCENGWVHLVAGPGVEPVVGIVGTDGQVKRMPLTIGKTQPIEVRGAQLQMRAARLIERSRQVFQPVIEPLDRRRPSVPSRSMSAVRLRIRGKGAHGDWQATRWCAFSQYPDDDPRPARITTPWDGREYQLIYSRAPVALGATLIPEKLSVKFFPGRRSVESWRSDFLVKPDGSDKVIPGAVYTNETFNVNRWTLFQSGAATDHWSYTILGVGSRNGIIPMGIACLMITLGSLWAFYVKPVLRRRRTQRVLAEARAATDSVRPMASAEREDELAKVGS